MTHEQSMMLAELARMVELCARDANIASSDEEYESAAEQRDIYWMRYQAACAQFNVPAGSYLLNAEDFSN